MFMLKPHHKPDKYKKKVNQFVRFIYMKSQVFITKSAIFIFICSHFKVDMVWAPTCDYFYVVLFVN